jgi:hypothetical protein
MLRQRFAGPFNYDVRRIILPFDRSCGCSTTLVRYSKLGRREVPKSEKPIMCCIVRVSLPSSSDIVLMVSGPWSIPQPRLSLGKVGIYILLFFLIFNLE